MTHVVKYKERCEGTKKIIKKDVVHAATVVECPPHEDRWCGRLHRDPPWPACPATVWAGKLDREVLRRFYRNWRDNKKEAFTKCADKYKADAQKKAPVHRDLDRIRRYATVVRVICATQMNKLNLRQQKAHVFEVQVNGGDIAKKVDWAWSKFEQMSPLVRSSSRTSELTPAVSPRVRAPRA